MVTSDSRARVELSNQDSEIRQLRTEVERLQAAVLYHDQDTMWKVHEALRRAGLTGTQAINVVNDMQNQGILFREAPRERVTGPPEVGIPEDYAESAE